MNLSRLICYYIKEHIYFTTDLRTFSKTLSEEISKLVELNKRATRLQHQPFIWISSLDSGTRGHYDAFDNIFIQLYGNRIELIYLYSIYNNMLFDIGRYKKVYFISTKYAL